MFLVFLLYKKQYIIKWVFLFKLLTLAFFDCKINLNIFKIFFFRILKKGIKNIFVYIILTFYFVSKYKTNLKKKEKKII